MFGLALQTAIRGWSFTPAREADEPIGSEVLVTAIFRPATLYDPPGLGQPLSGTVLVPAQMPLPVATPPPPSYPPTARGSGVVIVEVEVDRGMASSAGRALWVPALGSTPWRSTRLAAGGSTRPGVRGVRFRVWPSLPALAAPRSSAACRRTVAPSDEPIGSEVLVTAIFRPATLYDPPGLGQPLSGTVLVPAQMPLPVATPPPPSYPPTARGSGVVIVEVEVDRGMASSAGRALWVPALGSTPWRSTRLAAGGSTRPGVRGVRFRVWPTSCSAFANRSSYHQSDRDRVPSGRFKAQRAVALQPVGPTSRCWRLVSDQRLIRCGRTSLRHRLPRL